MGQEGSRGGRGFREARLAKTYDLPEKWLGESDKESLKAKAEVIMAWERMGLNVEGLYLHLLDAAQRRVDYEGEQKEIAREKLMSKRGRRRDLATIAGSGPLVQLMKKSRATVPGSRGEDLGEAVETWARQYVDDQLALGSRKPARGRPGEQWCDELVIHLAEQMQRVGQSWNKSMGFIYEALRIVGMDDLITWERVRHTIRRERKRRPGFGRAPVELCKLCVGKSGIGQALEDYKRTTPAERRRLMQRPRNRRILRRYRQKAKMLQSHLHKKRLVYEKTLLRKRILQVRRTTIG
jgi:hypothetical protein